MCGIIFLAGPNAGARLPECLKRLRHRGPDAQSVWLGADVALGFTRLAINGQGPASEQPYHHADLVGVVNGEIYNHSELADAFGLPASDCDTHVVLPLLERQGARVIDELDGFYSAVAFRPSTRELICLRDHIGKKPLLVGRSRGELFITSELKALDHVDHFGALPRGVSRMDLDTGSVTQVAEHRSVQPKQGLVRLLERAVRKRLPRSEQPVGVFLSGGLDSSLVAAFVSRQREDATYFTLQGGDSPDREAVEVVAAALGLRDVRVVELPSPARIPELVRSVVHATESYNPSVVSNGLGTFLLAKAAHEVGIQVVLTGEGADELFGGYHSFRAEDPWREVREQLIGDMHFTELRRLDLSCMAHSIEARCPFLDREVRSFSDGLSFGELYEGAQNKITLRRAFEGVLPQAVLRRTKTSLDVGSGVRGRVVEYLRQNGRSEREVLRGTWTQLFSHDASQPYFHAYPAFDGAIDRRGASHR